MASNPTQGLVNPFSRRSFLIATLSAGAASVAIGLTGCSNDNGGATGGATGGGNGENLSNAPFIFQAGWYPNAEYMGQVVALSKGYYTEEGLKMTLSPGGPNVVSPPLVANGQAQAASSSLDKIAGSYLNGLENLRVIGSAYQKAAACIVSLAETGIKTPQDMVGKRFGISQIDIPVYDAFFKLVGVNPDDVEYVPSASDPAMLTAGEIDAISGTLSNVPVTLRLKGFDVNTIALGDYDYNPWSGTQFTSQEVLDDPEKLEMVKAYLRATVRGYQDAHDNPEEAAQIIVDTYGDKYGYDLEVITESAKQWAELLITDETEANGLLTMGEEGIARQGMLLKDIGQETPMETLMVPGILDEIFGDSNHL